MEALDKYEFLWNIRVDEYLYIFFLSYTSLATVYQESKSQPTSPSPTAEQVSLRKSALEARKEALKASRLGSSKSPEVAPRAFAGLFKPQVSAPEEVLPLVLLVLSV